MLALVAIAAAYELEGWAWPADRLPIEVHWTGETPGFTHDELAEAVDGAAAAWSDAGPCSFAIEAVEDEDASDWADEGGTTFLFGDPWDELGEGVPGVGYFTPAAGGPVRSNGNDYSPPPAVLFVYNDEELFATDANIHAGKCRTYSSMQGLLTHDLGHALGLGHSCESGELCNDEDARDATMYWAQATCSEGASSLGSDDIEGLQELYGEAPTVRISCAAETDGSLTIACTVSASDGDTGAATWDFGDGSTGTGAKVTHDYAAAGRYEISVCVDVPDCDHATCQNESFYAGTSGTSTGWQAPDDDQTDIAYADACGGCGTTAPWGTPAGAALMALVASARRSRRKVL